ncbi:MAG: biosynthetic-type acetolactate synthase large subunit [Firmicutes bacterium]|nr:biosynthetic-type acetolactate synthase large subunit [Bacillota bacterium]
MAAANGARALLDTLAAHGVDVIFGYPGGAALPLYDALYASSLRHVLVRHEQGAAHAADGYARATGRVGVALSTSGPGATNLVTGLLTAHMDGVPLLAITGQVATSAIGTDAFQEADTLGIMLPVTKAALQPRTAAEVAQATRDAIRVATSGRPGPVVLDLPKDVAAGAGSSDGEGPPPLRLRPRLHASRPDEGAIRDLLAGLWAAKRPLVLVGHGAAGAAPAVRRFLERLALPSMSTLLGLGTVPDGFPGYLGMIGMHGTVEANRATLEADFLLSLGARFDDRAVGDPSRFAPRATIAHVDIEPAQLGKTLATRYPVAADVGAFLRVVERLLPHGEPPWGPRPWAEAPPRPEPPPEPEGGGPLSALTVFARLRRVLRPPYRIVTDVGQHQMWAALHLPVLRARDFITSGGLGTMGFGLPAALGVQAAFPQETVWLITGDGSFVMAEHELATAVTERLPVRIVVLDNRGLGMVRQWQELFYGGRYSHVDLGGVPDFVRLAEAYGVKAFRSLDADALERDLAAAQAVDGPALVHVPCRQEENVYPMIPPGGSAADLMVAPGSD